MEYVNLTPHQVTNNLSGVCYLASGQVARVSSTSEEVAPGHFLTTFGRVEGLPEPRSGVLLIVSALVRTQLPDRGDVISPGELIRDFNGQPLGCQGFNVNAGFYRHLTGGRFETPQESQEHFEFLDSLR